MITMGVRVIYIIPSRDDANVPLFSRYFHNVETRCKSRSGKFYVKIPTESEFVKLLFTETGLKQGDNFMDVRDHCDKEFSKPALQLMTDSGILWPVIVMEHETFIYCAITFEESPNVNHQSSRMKLALLASVTTCLEVLNGLAHYVEHHALLQGKLDATDIHQYINVALPFGRPVCCDPSVALSLHSSTWRGKVKQPAWNPLQHKGKSRVLLCIKEEIRCIQFAQKDMNSPIAIYGRICCTSDVEGVAPEISLVLTNTSQSKCELLMNACVSSIEKISLSSTRIGFHPVKSHNLCFYKMSDISHPPIFGNFSMKVKDDIASLSVHLKLETGVKNWFQRLEVHIPLNCFVFAVKSHCSQGSLVVGSKNTLIWNVGMKLQSKTLEASVQARAKLQRKKCEKSLDRSSSELLHTHNDKVILTTDHASEIENTVYASVFFTIMDYTYSGCKIDAQSVIASTTSKVNRSVACECFSGIYKIRNSEIVDNIIDDSLVEDIMSVVENT